MTFPHYLQIDSKDCGAIWLKIFSKLNVQTLLVLSITTRELAN